MLSVRLTLTGDAPDPNGAVNVYSNVNAVGNAAGEIDADNPLNRTPLAMIPGGGRYHAWAETEHGVGPWADSADMDLVYDPPLIHFGLAKFGFKAVDAAGNEQAAAIAEAELFVNSAPTAPSRFTRGAYTDSRQWFSFLGSVQLEEVE